MTKNLFIQWAENEIKEAERELDWLAAVRSHGHSVSNESHVSYWQGYFDAMNNAAAAYSGPTPLEREEN